MKALAGRGVLSRGSEACHLAEASSPGREETPEPSLHFTSLVNLETERLTKQMKVFLNAFCIGQPPSSPVATHNCLLLYRRPRLLLSAVKSKPACKILTESQARGF